MTEFLIFYDSIIATRLQNGSNITKMTHIFFTLFLHYFYIIFTLFLYYFYIIFTLFLHYFDAYYKNTTCI